MKQGGWSWNSGSKKGGKGAKYRCSVCGRQYVIQEMMLRHEKNCKAYNGVE
jgi:transposase-like protein